jgi:hypothetical protein
MNALERAGLGRWLSLMHLSEAEVMARYSPKAEAVAHNVAYQELRPLSRIQTPDAHFYFRDGQPAMLYINDWALGSGGFLHRRDAMLDALGKPEASLQSRAGKPHRQYVYPQLGAAFSAGPTGSIDFIELFPPTDLDTYKAQFYGEAPVFRR